MHPISWKYYNEFDLKIWPQHGDRTFSSIENFIIYIGAMNHDYYHSFYVKK